MTIKGTFKNGIVIPDSDPKVPDGTKVEMLILDKKPLRELVLKVAGTIKGPPDFAQNHDHYIHGTPKR